MKRIRENSLKFVSGLPNSPRRLSLRFGAGLAFAIALFSNAAVGLADDIEILFDNMSNQNYSGFWINSNGFPGPSANPDDISDVSFEASSGAGNPAPSFSIIHQHDVDRDTGGVPLNGIGTTFLQSSFTNEVFTYNPFTERAFSTVSFSLDVNLPVSSDAAAFDQVYFSIRDQNFLTASGFTNITGQSGWQTITVNGLTSADFLSSHDFSGPLDLFFGFGFTSSGDVSAGPSAIAFDVDNFRVSISAVPEPASLLLLAPFALGAAMRFQYRKNRVAPKLPRRS